MAQQHVDTDRLDAFAAEFHGAVVRPGDPEYDDVRAVWNRMIDKYPAVVARCAGVADVVHAVTFARENDLLLAVRGGGHNVAGSAVCDDGLVVDLSEMTAVSVDPEGETAWVQAGATWADVDHETQAFGLAAPGGVVSDTGVAGLTLGGGIGHLRCKHGLTCDSLRSVELVTAEASTSPPARRRIRSCSGDCVVAAEISGSSPPSSSTSIGSGPRSRRSSCSIPAANSRPSSKGTASTWPTRPTR